MICKIYFGSQRSSIWQSIMNQREWTNYKLHLQYDDPVSNVDRAASWSSVKRRESSCQVSWCVFLKLLAHLWIVVEIGICSAEDQNMQSSKWGFAHRIMCVFQHHCRQEPWHPFLDGVRETVNESTYANDSGVPLTDSSIVNWRYAIRELNLSRQFDKSVLDQRVDKIKRRCDYWPTFKVTTLRLGDSRSIPDKVLNRS